MSAISTLFLCFLAAISMFHPQVVLSVVFLLYADSLLATMIAAIIAYYLPWRPPGTMLDALHGQRRGQREGGEQPKTKIIYRDRYSPVMDDEAAREVLGIVNGASSDVVKRQHRDLARLVHPDKGGTTGLMTIVNTARDRLLGR